MIKPYSLKLSDIAIPDIDFKANRIVSVIIDDLKKGILKTQLVLQLNDVVSQVDYPAEKAIALALKEGIPIVM